jgi:2-oxoglutarate ferredoxin oxidoreductase subunit alpha
MNLGQLSVLLRATYLVDAESRTNVRGMPFGAEEMEDILLEALTSLERGTTHRRDALETQR